MDAALPAVFLLGFVTGFKHAFEPDHVIAISTLLHREPRWRKAVTTGMAWGAGHTTMLMAGVAVIGIFRLELSETMLGYMELPVAVMLLALGIWALYGSIRSFQRLREHTHDGIPHLHVGEHPHPHGFGKLRATGWRSYSVGLVHGLAGSGALLLLAAATLPSLALSLIYALIFGVGSIFGMMGVTAMLAYPFLASRSRPTFYNLLTGASGVLSIVLAAWIFYDVL